jgi:hypothetical protein
MFFKKMTWPLSFMCGALISVPTFSKSSQAGEAKALRVAVFPQGCSYAIKDSSEFLIFFDLAIETIAAKSGPKAKGVPELFAVSEIRQAMNRSVVNPQEEPPVDQLIVKQLCKYQSIMTVKKGIGESTQNPLTVTSDNADLHDHLKLIAPKLYSDSRALAVELLSEREKAAKRQNLLTEKWQNVLDAREEGRSKIRDLFN